MTSATANTQRRHSETEPLTFSMVVVAAKLGLSNYGLRKAIAEHDDFPVRFRVGKREHVLAADLNAWAVKQMEAARTTRAA